MRPEIGFALSGGGARGSIHLGILKRLARENLKIVAITGTSAGAIVGSAYAFRRLYNLEKYVLSFDRKELKSLMDPSFSKGILKGKLFEERLEKILGRHRIEDSSIYLGIVAFDLKSERDICFTRGPLSRLVHASCSVPFVFEPVTYAGMSLVDGGVLNNLPVDALLQVDIKIGVNLENSNFDKRIGHAILTTGDKISERMRQLRKDSLTLIENYEQKILKELRSNSRLAEYIMPAFEKLKTYLAYNNKRGRAERISSIVGSTSFSSLLLKSVKLYYKSLGRKPCEPPDLIIDACKDRLSAFNLLAMPEGISIGERYAEEYLPKINRIIEEFEKKN
ncbi:MAG: patatin-like phospholipase family protein [Candidatus Woesearchaeota archaeon]